MSNFSTVVVPAFNEAGNIIKTIEELSKLYGSTVDVLVVVKNKLVNYKHIVEKGKWDHRVKKILKQRGLTFNFNGVKFYKISTLTKIKNIIVMKIILSFFGYRLLK